MVRALYFSCLFVLCCAMGFGQAQQPTITFTLDFPQSVPEHYSITVHADGKAQYASSGRLSPDSDQTDSFTFDFLVSSDLRQKLFELAKRAKYFQHDADSRRKNIAFTGKKTLVYKDAEHSGTTTFNYTTDAAVQQLTNLFQGLSSTLETGHRLEYAHRYQKLALDEELKRAEEMAQTNPPVDLQAIAPILKQIVSDGSVMNVARARAQRLLALANP